MDGRTFKMPENDVFVAGEIHSEPQVLKDDDGKEYVHFLLHFPEPFGESEPIPSNLINFVDCISYDQDCIDKTMNQLQVGDKVNIGDYVSANKAHLMFNRDYMYPDFKYNNGIIFDAIWDRQWIKGIGVSSHIKINGRICKEPEEFIDKNGDNYYLFTIGFPTYPYSAKSDPYNRKNYIKCVARHPGIRELVRDANLKVGDRVIVIGALFGDDQNYLQQFYGLAIDVGGCEKDTFQ